MIIIQPVTWTVSRLTNYLAELLDCESELQRLLLEGEISNFKKYRASGHIYFTLKDERSQIKAVMFAAYAKQLQFLPRDGDQVRVEGRVAFYASGGQMQFYVRKLELAGAGALYIQFTRLKEKLLGEGLFSRPKKKLPPFPHAIGVITSLNGAALQDILSTLKRRWPLASVMILPRAVQGMEAAQELISALEIINQVQEIEVIVLGRGGGSFEELSVFNNEALSRAIAASGLPVVSAVGHETDVTISDFVADKRAATPTAAAELLTPD
ncbi:MAG: hypothetical protein RLZ12_660, partial [Bacillota bacterium]